MATTKKSPRRSGHFRRRAGRSGRQAQHPELAPESGPADPKVDQRADSGGQDRHGVFIYTCTVYKTGT